MNVKITHRNHFSWEVLPPGQAPGPGEQTRPIHPAFPDGPFQVRRLVPSDPEVHYTTLEIPEGPDGFKGSLKNYALAQGHKGKPTEAHRRYLLSRHISDIVHDFHSPTENWTDIVVDGDPETTAFLRRRFIDDAPTETES